MSKSDKNPGRAYDKPVEMGFEKETRRIAISDIKPLKLVSDAIKNTPKYAQITASIREVGIVEPPMVTADPSEPGQYLLLDGHLRIAILRELGEVDVVCLISTDDEAFTYNRRVNRLAIIQEHKMILKAIDRGTSEERIAKALNVNVRHIQLTRRLLNGICSEAAELLKDKHISYNAITELKKLGPIRQIEAAELMITMNKYTAGYARFLVAATPQDQLANQREPKSIKGITSEQLALMERESSNLQREFKVIEQSYGTDHLDLVLAKGYLTKLVKNSRILRYLNRHHHEILVELQKIAELENTAA
jgi:ParB-like chromosome segregation protein Spo0J